LLDGSFKGKPRSDFDVNHKQPTKKRGIKTLRTINPRKICMITTK